MNAFNLATCSRQDFATRMASCSAFLLLCTATSNRSQLADYADTFARELHDAMGWRDDHAERM